MSPRSLRWLAAGALAASALLPTELVRAAPRLCVFHAVTGRPCPSCGMTRSWNAMGHGQIREAADFHPMGPIAFVVAAGLVAVGDQRALRLLEEARGRARPSAPSASRGSWPGSGASRETRVADLRITVGDLAFSARWEEAAPRTREALRPWLPIRSQLIHCKWSGEGTWIPFGDRRPGVGYENHTSHPAPGQLIIYTGDLSECEILLAYGACDFSSKLGQLAGNHFAT